MTTFPPLFQPWPTAGKYHSTLFPTKPLSVSLPAGACVMSIAGSDPMYQPSTRVHIPSDPCENTGDMVGLGIQTQDLFNESLAPYRSELSRQPIREAIAIHFNVLTCFI